MAVCVVSPSSADRSLELGNKLSRNCPKLKRVELNSMSEDRRHRIVIAGADSVALFAAKALSGVAAEVTLIDRHNYHLFQPLPLPGGDGQSHAFRYRLADPLDLTGQRNVSVLLGEVQGVTWAKGRWF